MTTLADSDIRARACVSITGYRYPRVYLPGIGWRTITRWANCKSCGKFKSRPASVCGSCGDDPVTYGGSRFDYDRAMGWEDFPPAGYPERDGFYAGFGGRTDRSIYG